MFVQSCAFLIIWRISSEGSYPCILLSWSLLSFSNDTWLGDNQCSCTGSVGIKLDPSDVAMMERGNGNMWDESQGYLETDWM